MTYKKTTGMRNVFYGYCGIFLVIFCVIAGAVLQCAPGREPAKEMNQSREKDYVPGEVLVRFGEGITREQIDEIAGRLDMKLIKTISTPDSPIYHFKLPDGLRVSRAVKDLEKMPEVKHAQPNMIKRLYPVRNPPPAFLLASAPAPVFRQEDAGARRGSRRKQEGGA